MSSRYLAIKSRSGRQSSRGLLSSVTRTKRRVRCRLSFGHTFMHEICLSSSLLSGSRQCICSNGLFILLISYTYIFPYILGELNTSISLMSDERRPILSILTITVQRLTPHLSRCNVFAVVTYRQEKIVKSLPAPAISSKYRPSEFCA